MSWYGYKFIDSLHNDINHVYPLRCEVTDDFSMV